MHLIAKHDKVGGCGGMFPQENFRPSEIVSGAVLGEIARVGLPTAKSSHCV